MQLYSWPFRWRSLPIHLNELRGHFSNGAHRRDGYGPIQEYHPRRRLRDYSNLP